MKNSALAILSFLLGTFIATSIFGQSTDSLLEIPKLDWNSIGKDIAKIQNDQPGPTNKTITKHDELIRAQQAVQTFLRNGGRKTRPSKIDGVWKSARGVYYIFDGQRSAQLLFLDIMSESGPAGPPLVLDSSFTLTQQTINFDPGNPESRHVPFELQKQQGKQPVLRMNLNGDKWSTWNQVKFDMDLTK